MEVKRERNRKEMGRERVKGWTLKRKMHEKKRGKDMER